MRAEVGETHPRQAALARAQRLARAAQPQVCLGDDEAVRGLAQDLQPFPGDGPERGAVEEHAGRGPLAAPDPAAQLVQLGEAEALGLLDHDHAGLRHVDPDLDHGRGYEEAGVAAAKASTAAAFSGPAMRPWTSPTTSPKRSLSAAYRSSAAAWSASRTPRSAGRPSRSARRGASARSVASISSSSRWSRTSRVPIGSRPGGFVRKDETAMSP